MSNLDDGILLRPFAGYEFKRTVVGNTQTVAASFEGAPQTVAPFAITTLPDANLHQISGGIDIMDNSDWNLRFAYTGTFGMKTRQDAFSVKVAIPF